ncbi:transposase, partial [Escherichia coli O78:H12 str. 00-3279]
KLAASPERRIKLSLGAVSPEMYRQQCGLK